MAEELTSLKVLEDGYVVKKTKKIKIGSNPIQTVDREVLLG